MRKLFSVPVLAFLMAIPSAQGSPDRGEFDAVPHLVAVSRLPAAPSKDADNARSLIASSVAGDPLDHQEARDRLRAATRGAQRDVARKRAAAEQGEPVSTLEPEVTTAPVSPELEAIAACESGGDPAAIGGGGAYRGKYQFSPATWQAVGGSGDPATAPEAEQDHRAALLYAESGPSQWPVCGG